MVEALTSWNEAYGGAPWLILPACAGLCLLVSRIARAEPGARARRLRLLVAALAAPVVLYTALLAGYRFSDLRLAISGRLMLPYAPALIALALVAAAWAVRRLPRLQPVLVAAVALSLALSVPQAQRAKAYGSVIRARMYDTLLPLVREEAKPPHTLVITAYSNLFTIHRYGSVSFEYARENWDELRRLIANHFFGAVLVVQDIELATNAPLPGEIPPTGVELALAREFQQSGSFFLRVSRLTLSGAPPID